MRKILFSAALAAAAMLTAGTAAAHGGTAWSVSIGTGGFGVGLPVPIYAPPPVVYAPPMVYAPPVVRPVRVYAPPVVYAPAPVPVYVGAAPYYGYYGPPNRGWRHRHGWRRHD